MTMTMLLTENDKRERIKKFVTSRLGASRPSFKIKYFSLLDGQARQAVVEMFDVSQGEVNVLEVATAILDAANEDAQAHRADVGGTNSRIYYVKAYFGESPKPQDGRCTFYVEMQQSEDGPTSPSTGNIAMDQALRSTEKLTAMYLAGTQALLTSQARLCERMQAENEGLQERTVNLISTYASMLDRKQERDLAIKEIESQENVKKAAIAQFMPFAAAFVQKIVGVKAEDGSSPGQAAAVLASANQFLKSLQPDQVSQLQQILSPNQQLMVMQLMQTAEAEQQAQQTEKTAAVARQLSEVLPESPTFVKEV